MGKDPKEMGCDWCGEPSVIGIQRQRKIKKGFFGTGTFLYACGKHKHLAEAERVVKSR